MATTTTTNTVVVATAVAVVMRGASSAKAGLEDTHVRGKNSLLRREFTRARHFIKVTAACHAVVQDV